MTHQTHPDFDDDASAEAVRRARRDAPVYAPVEEAETIRPLQALPVYEPQRDVAPAVMEAVAAIDAADMAATADALRALPPYQPRRNVAHSILCAVRHLAKASPEPFFQLPSRWAALRAAAVAALLLGTAGLLVQRPVGPSRGTVAAQGAPSASPVREGGAWLLARQLPQGGWDAATLGGRPEFAPALTALGLLALHREDPAANRTALLRGAEALRAMQAPDGSFGRGEALRLNQTLVSAVLLEINQTLQSPVLGESIAAALDFSRRAAASGDGTWGYASGAAHRRPAAAGLFASPGGTSPERALREGLRDLPRLRPADDTPFYTACLAALDLR